MSVLSVVQVPEDACGFSVPYDFGGCDTEEFLGTNQNHPLVPILQSNMNNNNFLAGLTALTVSNFNGAHFASSFTVGVDSTAVVPVPAALLMYLSALGVCVTRKLVR